MFLFYAAAVLLAMAIKQYVIHIRDGYLQVHLPIRLDAFVAGMCAATYAQHRRWSRRVAAAAFVVGLAGLFATPWIYAAYPFGGHYFDLMGMSRPVWVQASLCLFLLGLVGEPHFGVRLFANRVTVWLGLVSYSIYLVHVPILGLLPKLGAYPALGLAPDNSLARILLFAVPAVVAFSALLYYSIEKPFQDSGRVAAGAAAATPARRRLLRRPFTVLFLWAVALFAFLLVVRQ
jgi:peptidoglycan/LPS O-acetylase OafA/YrhL